MEAHPGDVQNHRSSSFCFILNVQYVCRETILSLYCMFSLDSASISSVAKTNDYLFIFYFSTFFQAWMQINEYSLTYVLFMPIISFSTLSLSKVHSIFYVLEHKYNCILRTCLLFPFCGSTAHCLVLNLLAVKLGNKC